jgi:hypothetical protein
LDKPNKKIDFFVGGHYVCSSTRYSNLKEAKEGFMRNPSWVGLKPDGSIGLFNIPKGSYFTVSVWWGS